MPTKRINLTTIDGGGQMSREFDVIIERDSEGYYVASVPALPGCHTQAQSLDELSERIQEAIALYLDVEGEPTEPLDFVGIQRVTVGR
jgi:predicted RNase H-like HicB family nuclease